MDSHNMFEALIIKVPLLRTRFQSSKAKCLGSQSSRAGRSSIQQGRDALRVCFDSLFLSGREMQNPNDERGSGPFHWPLSSISKPKAPIRPLPLSKISPDRSGAYSHHLLPLSRRHRRPPSLVHHLSALNAQWFFQIAVSIFSPRSDPRVDSKLVQTFS